MPPSPSEPGVDELSPISTQPTSRQVLSSAGRGLYFDPFPFHAGGFTSCGDLSLPLLTVRLQ